MSLHIIEPYSITSANATVYMVSSGIFPIPFKLEGFGIDVGMFSEKRDTMFAVMGVDGKICAGAVRNTKNVSIKLMANSPSLIFIDTILQTQEQLGTVSKITLLVSSSALARSWLFTDGYLVAGQDMPEHGNVWEDREFNFLFRAVAAVPMGFSL